MSEKGLQFDVLDLLESDTDELQILFSDSGVGGAVGQPAYTLRQIAERLEMPVTGALRRAVDLLVSRGFLIHEKKGDAENSTRLYALKLHAVALAGPAGYRGVWEESIRECGVWFVTCQHAAQEYALIPAHKVPTIMRAVYQRLTA